MEVDAFIACISLVLQLMAVACPQAHRNVTARKLAWLCADVRQAEGMRLSTGRPIILRVVDTTLATVCTRKKRAQ